MATTLLRQFRAGLLRSRPQAGESVRRLAGQLAVFQVAIYLVQEVLERLEAGVAPHALLGGRLLVVGAVVRVAIAVGLAVLLAAAGRVAEAAGRALRQPPRHPEAIGVRLVDLVVIWPSRLLAAGLGSRAPPRSSAVA